MLAAWCCALYYLAFLACWQLFRRCLFRAMLNIDGTTANNGRTFASHSLPYVWRRWLARPRL